MGNNSQGGEKWGSSGKPKVAAVTTNLGFLSKKLYTHFSQKYQFKSSMFSQAMQKKIIFY